MEKCRLGPVREWLQPGIGHGSRSIIWIVASRGGGHSGGIVWKNGSCGGRGGLVWESCWCGDCGDLLWGSVIHFGDNGSIVWVSGRCGHSVRFGDNSGIV